MKTAIQPKRQDDFPGWYQAVIQAAELASQAPVRGSMVMEPWGYALWEQLQHQLNLRLQQQGVQNVYLPLFIPLSFFAKEAEHVEGFAKECAVVTHHRLAQTPDGLQPDGPLEEPLVVRPTSEPLFGDWFSKKIKSYRDLPLVVNQWANVVRWEMRTRLFLRTTEFLWQEGHTAHASAEEAHARAKTMIEVYAKFAREHLAIPVLVGEKTPLERFGGADVTYTIEAMMQDGKALQAGTSHYLGQHFAKAFAVEFQNEHNQSQLAYTTSWGMTTRLLGALIMVHGDDDGLRLPPWVSPYQVVICPMYPKSGEREAVDAFSLRVAERLRHMAFAGSPLRVHIDQRDLAPGEKAWSWYKKGVPLRIEIGAREASSETITGVWRDQGYRSRQSVDWQELDALPEAMQALQQRLYDDALQKREARTVSCRSETEVLAALADSQVGFIRVPFAGDSKTEEAFGKQHGVSVRLIIDGEAGACFLTGQPASEVVIAKAY